MPTINEADIHQFNKQLRTTDRWIRVYDIEVEDYATISTQHIVALYPTETGVAIGLSNGVAIETNTFTDIASLLLRL